MYICIFIFICIYKSLNIYNILYHTYHRMFTNMGIVNRFDITRTFIHTTIKKYVNNHISKYSGLYCIFGGITFGSTIAYYGFSNRKLLYSYYKAMTGGSKTSNLDDKKAQEEPYENKYYDLFEKMETHDLEEDTVKGMKNNVLYEITPKGNVIMYYDFEKESFVYYCDTKDIPYLYLETVARKYALAYDCKKIVVDIKKEIKDAKQKNINDIHYGTLSTIQENIINRNNRNNTPLAQGKMANETFASFKSYNRKGTGGSKSVINKKFILRQNANRYSYSGKIGQFPILKTDDYKIEKPMEKMDYKTFKKLMTKKN